MSETKTLRSVLGEQVNIPKSYTRYLDCSVVSQQQKNIFIKTPKGNTLIFKVEGNSLKKLTATSHMDIQNSEDNNTINKGINTSTPASASVSKDVNDLQKQMESVKDVNKAIPDLQKRIEALEKIPQQDIVFISSNEWKSVQEQLQKNSEYQQKNSEYQQQNNEYQNQNSEYQQKITALEERLLKLEEKLSLLESSSSKSETMQKVARGSAKAAVVGSKFLWQHPRVFAGIVAALFLMIWQPWSYFGGTGNENPNGYTGQNLGKRNTNYIIKKNSSSTSNNTSSRKSQHHKTEDDGNYLSPQDRRYAKEIKEDNSSQLRDWVRKLKGLPPKERENEIRSMGSSTDPMTGKVLIAMLADPQVTWVAVNTLGEKRYRQAVPFLVEVLEDKNREDYVRAETCTSLGILGNPFTAKLLKKVFMDTQENEDVRLNAGLALGVIGDANVSPDLLEVVFNSQNPAIRQAAITTLGKFQYPAAITPITDVMNATEDIDLKRACIDALGQMRRKANDVAPTLVNMLEKGDPDLEDNLKASLRNLLSRLKPELQKRVSEMIQE
ncbi:HEAT repeat domain-containing protein [Candidatus Uabimicrobium amorphum]|uniref:HEAT repeat-containing PBS lyase n=1 Tax=Uabimicrobium amorphum TaxID=2596890 RepID=A0A5S9IKW4_UABAM|nr:HEAT repeat domain-containing protein [Candidatus Uabimicrobium amorphum]BBM82465.1 HEAT repeat-containing PBS lyase [Candidatus Uabimicrobium amorphum]